MPPVPKPELVPDHEGYFWVLRVFRHTKDDSQSAPISQWEIAYWRSEEFWEFLGEEAPDYKFEMVLEIGDEIEKPAKYRK